MSDNVDLLDEGREARAESTTKHNDFVLLRAEAGAVAQRELKLDGQQLPRPVFDVVSLDCVKPLLAVVATEGVDELLVDDRCGEGTLRDVHRCKAGPLVLCDVVNFAAAEEDILHSIVATHHVDVLAIHNGGMLLSHLIHAGLLYNLALRVIELVDGRRRTTACDESVAIRHGHRRSVVHKVESRVLRLDHVVAAQALAGRLRTRRMNGGIRDRLNLPLHFLDVEHHDLVRVAEESDLLVRHEVLVVVDRDQLLDVFLDVGESIKAELHGRIADLGFLQFDRLLFEIVLQLLKAFNF